MTTILLITITAIAIITLMIATGFWIICRQDVKVQPIQEQHRGSLVSETTKNVDWDPDDYKPLSQSRYEVFDEDDIEDAREQMTTHQRIHLGDR